MFKINFTTLGKFGQFVMELILRNKSATLLLLGLAGLFLVKLFSPLWFVVVFITLISAIFYCNATNWAMGVLKQFGKSVLAALFTFVGFGLFLFASGFYLGKYEMIAFGVLLVIFGLIKSGNKLSEKIPLGK